MTTELTYYHCKRCKGGWTAPSQKEIIWWRNLSDQRKGFLPEFGAMEWLRENTSLDEISIKCIISHQVREFNKCCHCDDRLNASGVVECRKCGATNYNFSTAVPQEKHDEP